jgi:hypothetical protein
MRRIEYYLTLWQISNQKINLEGYKVFSKEIMGGMKKKLESTLEQRKITTSIANIEAMEKLVAGVTKVAHLLIVVYMKLFRKHDQDFLTENEVNQTLEVLKELWFKLENGDFESKREKDWQMKVHKILTFKCGTTSGYGYFNRMDIRLHLSCNFFYYWLESSGDNFLDKLYHKELYLKKLIEIINKLIYNSNFEKIYKNIDEKMKSIKQRKKRKRV